MQIISHILGPMKVSVGLGKVHAADPKIIGKIGCEVDRISRRV